MSKTPYLAVAVARQNSHKHSFNWLYELPSGNNNKKMSAEGIIIKHFMISLEYTYSVHANTVHHNFWTSQVVWSRLRSTCRCQVKSNRVGCAQVDRHRLGVILASSRVTFLYLSDSQVYQSVPSIHGHNGLDATPLDDSAIKCWLIKLHSLID